MTRRQLLSALTGCAVAKPVIVAPIPATVWFVGPDAIYTFTGNTITHTYRKQSL